MSRLTELKKQYPELTISFMDILTRIDPTKSYKYLPILCKFYSERFKNGHSDSLQYMMAAQQFFKDRGLSTVDLSSKEKLVLFNLSDSFWDESLNVLREFIDLSEKKLLDNKDVTSYKNLDEIRNSISMAYMKEISKVMEHEVVREFEDETWVIVRPLTFSASLKYGATTKWCTTYSGEKNYFERYWKRGILVYFINKKTGYKFAGYKALDAENELSFWTATDQRVDFLDVDADEYLFPIVRKIFRSKSTNKDLCSLELQQLVMEECFPKNALLDESVNNVQELWLEQTTTLNEIVPVMSVRPQNLNPM